MNASQRSLRIWAASALGAIAPAAARVSNAAANNLPSRDMALLRLMGVRPDGQHPLLSRTCVVFLGGDLQETGSNGKSAKRPMPRFPVRLTPAPPARIRLFRLWRQLRHLALDLAIARQHALEAGVQRR